ncbi:MAG: sulfite exporter TauE/SafE family protein, partial [Coraliomargarita sp.]
YVIFGLCLFTGSAVRGAEFGLGFGLGTLPLLWLAQAGFMRAQFRLDANRLARLRRAVALLAALVLVWRLRASLGLEGAVEWLCA